MDLGTFTKLQKSELSNRGRTLNSLRPQIGFGLKEISDDEDVTKLNRTLKPFFCRAREPAFWLDIPPFPLKRLSPVPGFAHSQTRTTLACHSTSHEEHTADSMRMSSKAVPWLFQSRQHQRMPKCCNQDTDVHSWQLTFPGEGLGSVWKTAVSKASHTDL